MQNPILASIIWCAIIIGVFAPLAINKYKRATT
jgi:ABC-2 type transport system permease protein